MHRFIEIAKGHPYLIGGGVCVAALLIFFSFRTKAATGGTYAVADQNDTTNAQINAQLVMAQDAISGQTNQAQLALEAKENDNATALQLANGANATALAGATINAGSLLDQSKLSQQTSLLQLASATSLASQQMGLSAGLENQALQYQHYNDIYSDIHQMGWDQAGSQSTVEYELNEQGTGINGGIYGILKTPTTNTTSASHVNPLDTAAYTSGVSSLLAAIKQTVTPGDPTMAAASS